MSDIAAGQIAVVRDERWPVRSAHMTAKNGTRLEVTGVSEIVRDQNAVLHHTLDAVDRRLPGPVFDAIPGFRGSRLWLESVLRRSPLLLTDGEGEMRVAYAEFSRRLWL